MQTGKLVAQKGKKSQSIAAAKEIQLELRNGQACDKEGKWAQASASFERTIALCEAGQFVAQKAEALRWLGHIHAKQDRWEEAAQAYHQSASLCRQQDDQLGNAQAQYGLGMLAFERGEFGQAVAHLHAALEPAEKADDLSLMATIYNALGILATAQGQWQTALSHYEASLPRFEKIGDTASMAAALHNMAMTFADMQRWAEAGIHYERSHQLAQQAGDAPLQAMIKLNRVELYLAISDLAMAEALCGQALKTFIRLEDHLGEAEVYKFLGVIYTRRKAWQKAKSHFAKSLKLSQKYNSPLCEAETHYEYGRMLKQQGDNAGARQEFESAQALFGQINAANDLEKVKRELMELTN